MYTLTKNQFHVYNTHCAQISHLWSRAVTTSIYSGGLSVLLIQTIKR